MSGEVDEVRCARDNCGRRYGEHAPDGGPAGDVHQVGYCRGFLWVDPDGPPVGTYREPPRR